jgi:hypothetical protein
MNLERHKSSICPKTLTIWNHKLDGNLDATIQLTALKKLKKSQLASWRQFRTKNGLSNDALIGA